MEVPTDQSGELDRIHELIVGCRRCPRLVRYRERVAHEKKREFQSWEYWGKPVPGFGDSDPVLLILGLAPAAHGANRTGRVFTGDASSRFLTRALYDVGFANQPTSEHRRDGLRLNRVFVTSAVKCAPPNNRPLAKEKRACSSFLRQELHTLKGVRAVLTLGRFAFEAYTGLMNEKIGMDFSNVVFEHGAKYEMGDSAPALYVSYHPSPHNTNTGRLTREMFMCLLERIMSRLQEEGKRFEEKG